MKCRGSGAAWALVALLAPCAPGLRAQSPERSDTLPTAHLAWAPERPVQGHLFVLRVSASPDAPIVSLSGTAGGEALHFEEAAAGSWESLAPAPVDAEGAVAARVDVHYLDGSVVRLEAEVPVRAGEYRHEHLNVAPELGAPLRGAAAARLARDQEKANRVAGLAHETARLWKGAAVLPRDARVTGGFGDGRIFNGQLSSRHLGLDLNGATGDTVVAAARGVVALVDDFLLAGNIVYVNHGGGLLSGYFHLSEQLVAVGDTVQAGTPIGRVGATGRVTGPHLHWVVRYGTTSVDPRSLLEIVGR